MLLIIYAKPFNITTIYVSTEDTLAVHPLGFRSYGKSCLWGKCVIVQHHVVQARPLLNAGLEMLAFETVPAEKEGIAILKALDLLPARINCTPPKYISSLLRSANSNCNGKPFVVYPNSGEQYNVETKRSFV
uniref:Hcy-binding domain-containing protein n=1 Tax=Parascaris equorum TaxID=6256 RepID=A0A914S8G4_PAREQ